MNLRAAFRSMAAFAAFACAVSAEPAENATRRPNILYIMADDHAANAIGSYGSRLASLARTPNIDRLAQEGARLTNVFVTNSICVPSRATILTGQYSHRNGVYTLRDSLDPAKENVAKLLQAAGYQTAVIGKWHLKEQPAGFDYFSVLRGQGDYYNPTLFSKEGGKQYEGYSADIITGLSLQWLKNRDKEKPFFLLHHFKAPHGLWEYPGRHASLYESGEIPEPESLFEDKGHRSEASRDFGVDMLQLSGRVDSPKWPTGRLDTSGMSDKEKIQTAYQKYMKDYLRVVAAVDENVGRLLDYLDREGLVENTVVIYTSDQGMFLGEHAYYDKRWMYEEAFRMPFLVRYPPEIEAGSVNDDIINNADFAPMFLDYAGLPKGRQMQGRSFRANLAGNTPADWPEATYYRYWMHTAQPAHYGIRTKRYKLIFFYGLPLVTKSGKPTQPGWEFYDLAKDPNELYNRYRDLEYADVIRKLKADLRRLKQEVGDSDEPYPELVDLTRRYWE